MENLFAPLKKLQSISYSCFLAVAISTASLVGNTSIALAVNLPQQSLVPGGIAILELGENTLPRPQVTFNKTPITVLQNNNQWVAVIGIPLSAKIGQQTVQVRRQDKQNKVFFTIEDKAYRTQHITIKDKRKVNPNKNDMARITRERPQITNAFKHWRDAEDINLRFIAPVDGVQSGSFGSRRVFNKQPRRPHSGMDIAAAEGSPIIAPSAGKVIETGDYFFNGKSVFVDHGQGVITMYCHLSEIEVQKDQWVNTRDRLGKVGKTGRATGAHLHWTVSLNNTRVDPQLFLSE